MLYKCSYSLTLIDFVTHVLVVFGGGQRGAASGATSCDASSTNHLRPQSDSGGTTFVVYRQPIALDRVTVHDVLPPPEAAAAATVSSIMASSTRSLHPARSVKELQRNTGLTVDHGENFRCQRRSLSSV